MHPNRVFHTASRAENLAFAAERAFGVLSVVAEGAPLLSHVPFVIAGDEVDLHLVRSNPIARALGQPVRAVLAVSGPDSYISPDWYGIDDQVPTWNYVAVHLSGMLELRPQEELRAVLERETALFEQRLHPKAPWTAAKMDGEALDRMMRVIVPCRLRIEQVDGTWKLGQNKPDDVRERAADQVQGFGIGADFPVLAGLMRGAKKAP